MDTERVKNIIEAALLCAGRPMELNELLRMFDEAERPARKDALAIIESLREQYTERPIELVDVASGYRVQVREAYSEPLGRLSERRAPRYSRALLETLVLVAYRQPVTRGEIENVRGVSVSSNIVRTLLERGWVRIVGHRDVPGRPAMLGTTKEFLDYFNLSSLDQLPSLAELKDFDSINVEMDFEGDAPAPQLVAPDGTDDDDSDGVLEHAEADAEEGADAPAELAADNDVTVHAVPSDAQGANDTDDADHADDAQRAAHAEGESEQHDGAHDERLRDATTGPVTS